MEFLPIRPSIAAALAGSARQRRTTGPRPCAAPRYGASLPRQASLQTCRREEPNENCCSTVVCRCCAVSRCFFFSCRTSPDYTWYAGSFEACERCEHFVGSQRRFLSRGDDGTSDDRRTASFAG